MKKIISLSLALIMIIALIGCNSNIITISELWEMPELPYPLKVVDYGSPEIREFYVGSEEYEIDDSSIRAVLRWASALELKEVSFDEGEHPSENDGWSSCEFIIADKTAFSYADFGEDGYVIVDDIWYEVQNPSLPNFDELETYSLAEPKDWGITFTASDVTTTGLTLVCTQSGGIIEGELGTGDDYYVEKNEDGTWVAMEYLPDIDVFWNDISNYIPMNDKVKWEINYDTIYGKLPSGTYRIAKSIMNWIEAGNFKEQTYYATFEIENTAEIVEDSQILSEKELALFNDNYFDILYEEEGYHIRFSEGTRIGDEVQLIYRGYDPETGDAYEMLEHIVTLQQKGENYIYISYEPAV